MSNKILHDYVDLRLHPYDGTFTLLQDLDANLKFLGNWELEALIKNGFRTDLASIPKIARSFYTRKQERSISSIVHDWCYCTHIVDKATADKIFYLCMKEQGMNVFVRYSMYLAVKLGGDKGYNETSPTQFKRYNPDLFEKYYKG